ncbi:MAG: N-methyl-L-tryptophan oxidase [Planctomycetota bacterium]
MTHKPLDAEVLVLGVGSMGAAACHAIARCGVSVLGVDAHTIPNQRASHHGGTRMMRLSYHEHPNYVALLKEAWQMWRDLEDASGHGLLTQTGGLYLGQPDGDLLGGAVQSAELHDLPHRRLSANRLRKEFPAFIVPDDCEAVWDECAGYVFSERAILCMTTLAKKLGAKIREHFPIAEVQYEDDHICLRSVNGERVYGKHLIVTAGAGISVAELGLAPAELQVTRQELAWFEVAPAMRTAARAIPCWALEAKILQPNNPGLLYGFPTFEGEPCLKAALHWPGPSADAHSLLESQADALQPVQQMMHSLFPTLSGPMSRQAVCRYTNSADSHFIVDRHPTKPNTTIACGFSGHGFKFAPVIGEVLRELCFHGKSTRPVEFLALR